MGRGPERTIIIRVPHYATHSLRCLSEVRAVAPTWGISGDVEPGRELVLTPPEGTPEAVINGIPGLLKNLDYVVPKAA
jgi:hypothetical protein